MIRVVLNILNYLVTLLLSLAVVVSLVATVVSPATYSWLPYFSLAAPVLIAAMVVMMLINIVLIKPLAIVPIIVFIVSIFKMDSQFNYPLHKGYAQDRDKIMTVSHNVRMFKDEQHLNQVDSILNQLMDKDPRIIILQEFPTNQKIRTKVLERLKRFYVSIADYEDAGNDYTSLATFVRYPIVSSGSNMQDSLKSGYSWVDIVMKPDTVRLYNVHLKSNVITRETDGLTLNRESLTDSVMVENYTTFNHVLSKFCENSITRSFQADTLSKEIKESPYPVIVCGDFNDVPFSYSFNKIKGDLNDSFERQGSGYAYSYNKLLKLLKIDYILYSDYFKILSYDSPLSLTSDHNPIFVELAVDR